MMHKCWSRIEEVPCFFQGHVLNCCKVTWLKELSILTQIGCFWTVTPVWIHYVYSMIYQCICYIPQNLWNVLGFSAHGFALYLLYESIILGSCYKLAHNTQGCHTSTWSMIVAVPLKYPWRVWVNSLRPRQNKRHIADDVFKCNFWNENVQISIKISLKFVPKGPINIFPALVQIMAWRRTGDKPLSEPMMTQFNNTYMFASLLLTTDDFDGSVQYCTNMIANALELLQSCTKPSIFIIEWCNTHLLQPHRASVVGHLASMMPLEDQMLRWILTLFSTDSGRVDSGTYYFLYMLGVRVPLRLRHSLSQKLRHFDKNIRLGVWNECCFPSIVNITNVNFT